MKKECTCRKMLKDDKVTVLYKCKLCKKHDLKVFDKAIKLAKAIIELHTTKNVPVPKYKTGGKSVELIIDKNNYKEFVVCDGQNTPFPDYLKAKGYSDYNDWLNKISDKNTQRYSNKGMLEADKELWKVLENVITEETLLKIGFYKGLGLDYDIDEKGNVIVFKNGLFSFMGSETENIQYSFNIEINSIEKLLNIIKSIKY